MRKKLTNIRLNRLAFWVILIVALVGLYAGWRAFWFLTDDAFIAFRYISNRQLGYGYTWNFPPFRPVEGYTSFLWVFLLDIIWEVTGVEPPNIANTVSLIFSLLTLSTITLAFFKMRLSKTLSNYRWLLLFLLLFGILTNRTFLAWTSSGLETAMFNFFLTAWVISCLYLRPGSITWLGMISTLAALTALTRPDGLLLIAATFLLALLTIGGEIRRGNKLQPYLLVITPFLLNAFHFLWRKHKYGAWLPNTYAAKYVAPWPASGLRYLLSFMLEYAFWFWLILVGAFLVSRLWALTSTVIVTEFRSWLRSPKLTPWIVSVTVVGTLVAHFAYYTFIIGGDHFEYRVYSHLVPLILLSTTWLLNALHLSARKSLAFLALFIIFGLPIPWVHWAATQPYVTRGETLELVVPIAPKFPRFLQPYVSIFDNIQEWLIVRSVCTRHQEHKIFYQYQVAQYPSRDEGFLLSVEEYPVIVRGTVGVPAWHLPTTNIIDFHGLNDWVIARNHVVTTGHREMAHDRRPPKGYIACFEPNLRIISPDKIVVQKRSLTEEEIIACEQYPWPASTETTVETVESKDKLPELKGEVDSYLREIWYENLLYFSYLASDQVSPLSAQELHDGLRRYPGVGCSLSLPYSEGGYMFTFLHNPSASLNEVTQAFSWASAFAADDDQNNIKDYHLGYAAPNQELSALEIEDPVASWDNGLLLLDASHQQATYAPGDNVYLTLTYYGPTGFDVRHSFFSHLVDTSHDPPSLWGQDDGAPCRDLYPMSWLKPETVVTFNMAIPIAPDTPPGTYHLVTGIYNWQTMERVPVQEPLAGVDHVEVAQIEVMAP